MKVSLRTGNQNKDVCHYCQVLLSPHESERLSDSSNDPDPELDIMWKTLQRTHTQPPMKSHLFNQLGRNAGFYLGHLRWGAKIAMSRFHTVYQS